jgi:DNA-binding beta-propeller fold protein YncE
LQGEGLGVRVEMGSNMPPRRAFVRTALISLTSLAAGCAREEVRAPTADEEDLKSLRAVDPKYVAYRETGRIETAMHAPRGIACANGDVLVVVGDSSAIWFKLSGKPARSVDVAGDPTSVAVSPDGTTYVGLTDHVEVFSDAGVRTSVWPILGTRAHITSLALGRNDVFVADAGARSVLRCRQDGAIVARIGQKDEGSGYPGLIVPSPHLDVAAAADGGVYVSNPGMHRVEKHSAEGRFLSSWGSPANTLDAFCGCCNPTDFALLPDGKFVTSEKGIPRVKVYDAGGTFLEVVAGPDAFVSHAMGLDVCVTPDGRVLVLDPPSKSVRLFTRVAGKIG